MPSNTCLIEMGFSFNPAAGTQSGDHRGFWPSQWVLFRQKYTESYQLYHCKAAVEAMICHSAPNFGGDFNYILHSWVVVWNMFDFSMYWKNHPNWRTHMFQRGLSNHQPDKTSQVITSGHHVSWLRPCQKPGHRWNQAMRWAQVLAYRFLQRQVGFRSQG